MTDLLNDIFRTFWCVIVSFISLIPFLGTLYTPENPDSVLLTAAVAADLHADGNPVRDRNDNLRRAFAGISKASPGLDALVLVGDITNSAHEKEYTNLNRMMSAFNKTKTLIPAMGNHDARGTSIDPDFGEACTLFGSFCRRFGIETEKTYYSRSVNDYRFIVLGTEQLLENSAYVSDEQILWLDRELESASADGKPVFIICHQPLKGTVPGSNGEGAHLGEQSDRVKAVIEKYTSSGTTVVFFSGHKHSGFSAQTVTQQGNLWCVDLPSLQYCGADGSNSGDGMTLEVYSAKIVLRGINFISGARYANFRFEIPLE